MSLHTRARKGLSYVDPAGFTPHFTWAKSRDGGREVFCENVPLSKIARRHGTPTYVYSSRAITDAFAELDRGLGKLPHLLCFAVKSNGNLSLLKLLAEQGSGFDIVSGGELALLRHIGVPGNRIVFSGVGKTRDEIREGLRYRARRNDDSGILQFNVESPAELEILLEEAGRLRKNIQTLPGVSIRVNPDVKAGGHPHISTGLYEHKFGLVWPEARKLYLQHRQSKYIRWQGISAHIGSQIVELAPFRRALQRLASYVLDLRNNAIALKYLDFGGGLGVRYTNERPASRTAYARMVTEVVRPLGVGLLLEPGRSIIAPAGVLLTRVIYSKQNARKKFVVVDAAMNDLMRPALYDAPHPITPGAEPANKKLARERADIVGPVCETGDCFLLDWPLGPANPGDLLAIWAAGAYGMAQASNYNARPRPAEVLIHGTRATAIRRRESRRDLLQKM